MYGKIFALREGWFGIGVRLYGVGGIVVRFWLAKRNNSFAGEVVII